MSDEEAKRELLHGAEEFKDRDMLLEIAVRECAGNWLLAEECTTTLRTYLRDLNDGTSRNETRLKEVDEHELVLQMLDPEMATSWMHRIKLTPPHALVASCLGSTPEPVSITSEHDRESCTNLIEHAILEPCGPDGTHVRLLDPLREKSVLRGLFPVRTFLPVTSLDEVLDRTIAG